jgi:hypothetical protein
VLVDFHAAPGDTTVSSGNYVSDWQILWQTIVDLPNFSTALAGRIMLDLYNEPDGEGLQCADLLCSLENMQRLLHLSWNMTCNDCFISHGTCLMPASQICILTETVEVARGKRWQDGHSTAWHGVAERG